MVNNQIEFNEKYNNKEVTEIEIRRSRNFQGELVIEDYSELEKLNLRDIRSIDKVILKNLTQLQECTIWDCGTKELVIKNCPQIKKLNVRKNSLTSLECLANLANLTKLDIAINPNLTSLSFLFNLRNLTELEMKDNPKLDEILKHYKGDWRNWKGSQTNPKGSLYDIQSSKKVESDTSLKEESELATQIGIPPKGGN